MIDVCSSFEGENRESVNMAALPGRLIHYLHVSRPISSCINLT